MIKAATNDERGVMWSRQWVKYFSLMRRRRFESSQRCFFPISNIIGRSWISEQLFFRVISYISLWSRIKSCFARFWLLTAHTAEARVIFICRLCSRFVQWLFLLLLLESWPCESRLLLTGQLHHGAEWRVTWPYCAKPQILSRYSTMIDRVFAFALDRSSEGRAHTTKWLVLMMMIEWNQVKLSKIQLFIVE